MQKYFLFSFFVLLFLAVCSAQPQNLKINSNAPAFTVVSGAGQSISLNSLTGKIVVIIYEKKDAVKKTRPLKDILYDFYWRQSDKKRKEIVRLPVIDCSEAFWPITGIWRKKLIENSKKEGITIFGDWKGEMCKNYNLESKNSTIIILNKKGVIKYIASDNQCSGKEIKSTLEEI